MFDDKERTGERLGERGSENRENRNNNEYLERWEESMTSDDVPEFAGEWGYGELPESGGNEVEAAIAAGWGDLANMEPTDLEREWQGDVGDLDVGERSVKEELTDAAKITSYGFDTASRLYGLEPVIDAIVKTDETIDGGENPLGAVYRTLIPKVEERAHLYNEIQKDRVKNNQFNDDPNLNTNRILLGFGRNGDFYDRSKVAPGQEQQSVEAIRAVRRLVEILENDERFDALREQAYERDQTIIEHLMEEVDHPTITQLLNTINAETADDLVEEILDDVEKGAGQEGDGEKSDEKLSVAAEALKPVEVGDESQEDEIKAAS